jgi:hypothetical protein
LVVGDGPERQKMEEMVNRLGIDVILQERGMMFMI